MPAKLDGDRFLRQIPQARGGVIAAAGEESPVGMEGQLSDRPEVAMQHIQRPTGGRIPQPYGAIPAPSRDGAAIGAIARRAERVAVPNQIEELAPTRDIKDAGAVIVPCGQQIAIVGAEGDTDHRALVSLQQRVLGHAPQIDDADRCHRAR